MTFLTPSLSADEILEETDTQEIVVPSSGRPTGPLGPRRVSPPKMSAQHVSHHERSEFPRPAVSPRVLDVVHALVILAAAATGGVLVMVLS